MLVVLRARRPAQVPLDVLEAAPHPAVAQRRLADAQLERIALRVHLRHREAALATGDAALVGVHGQEPQRARRGPPVRGSGATIVYLIHTPIPLRWSVSVT